MLAWHHWWNCKGYSNVKMEEKTFLETPDKKIEIFAGGHGKFELKSRGGEGVSQLKKIDILKIIWG